MAGPSINDSADAPVGPSPAAHATPGAHRVHPPGRPGPDGEEDAAAPAAHVAPGAYMVYPSGHPGTDAEEDLPCLRSECKSRTLLLFRILSVALVGSVVFAVVSQMAVLSSYRLIASASGPEAEDSSISIPPSR